MTVDSAFWRGRRVFMTGHTGFKGTWLSLWLGKMGAHVTGYSLAEPVSSPNMFDLTHAASAMTNLQGDIRDLPALENAIINAKPELIIHMAAQALVRASYEDPIGNYATNVMGTVHVLDAARRCKSVRAILVVTSDKCYENREQMQGYSEADAMGGYDPYSSSKGCAELVASAYRRSYFNPQKYAEHGVALATARAGNVIGGGDWAQDRLVPDAIRAFIKGETVEVRSPTAIRPWQHVLEPLSGYLQLSQQLLGDNAAAFAEGWNFGPHEESEQPVEHILDLLTGKWGPDAQWRKTPDVANLHEAHYLKLDCTKAHEQLKWQPSFRLEQALELTADWYKAYQNKNDLRALTLAQIDILMNKH